jgi:hypothetical protein
MGAMNEQLGDKSIPTYPPARSDPVEALLAQWALALPLRPAVDALEAKLVLASADGTEGLAVSAVEADGALPTALATNFNGSRNGRRGDDGALDVGVVVVAVLEGRRLLVVVVGRNVGSSRVAVRNGIAAGK